MTFTDEETAVCDKAYAKAKPWGHIDGCGQWDDGLFTYLFHGTVIAFVFGFAEPEGKDIFCELDQV